jgi:hypothetical protein
LKQLHLLFLFLLISLPTYSQKSTAETNDTSSVKASLDSGSIALRLPNEKEINDFRNDRDYKYQRNTPPPENPFARFWYWLVRKFNDFFQSNSYENFWQYVILAAIGGLVVWLLYKAEFLGGLFGRKAEEDPLTYNRLSENIHELDFNSLIDDAIEHHNYRIAVRIYYLKTLKQLTDKHLIHWHPTKTNHIYVRELENSPLKEDFEYLTSQFEYVWYGEFGISELEFSPLKEKFQFFLANIK